MIHITYRRFRSLAGGLVALALFISTVVPVAYAANAGLPQGACGEVLTVSGLADMRLADDAVAALTSSEDFADMPLEERRDAADEQLQALAGEALIEGDSIYYDEENRMFTFSYSCGVLGGILLEEPDAQEPEAAAPLLDLEALETENGMFGTAAIYYAFDDPADSTRYPYYAAMQQSWGEAGLATRILTNLTVARMKRMAADDLCVLCMHGAYYTYTYGVLWQRTITAPILVLTEQSTWYKDLFYAADLLSHRVIKVNGLYCLLPSFFRSAYRSSQLEGMIVFSETCDFLGKGQDDFSLADAFLAAGAETVIGFRNTVYAIYSRNVMWDTVNQLILGSTAQQALDHATAHYGPDDVVWYSSLSTKPPHSPAAYPLLLGSAAAALR